MFGILLVLTIAAFAVLIVGPVVKKAGFPIWWSLLVLLPVFNLVMIWVFAFMSWPAEEKQQAALTHAESSE
jgi:hypothetical protein